MYNKATILGNVGQDPEVRQTPNGAKVATLSVATSERWKDKASGEDKERTEWHRVSVWGDGLCDFIAKAVKKGSQVFIEGRLQTHKWKDTQGIERWTTEIVVRGGGGVLRLLGKRPVDQRDTPPSEQPDDEV